MTAAHQAIASRLICPRCLTINVASATGCFHCKSPMKWLRERPESLAALRSWASTPPSGHGVVDVRCHISVRLEDVEISKSVFTNSQVSISLPDGKPLHVEWFPAEHKVAIRSESETRELSLPEDCEWGNATIRVWTDLQVRPTKDRPSISDQARPAVLKSGEVLIGREQSNTVQIGDPDVELRHCVIAISMPSDQAGETGRIQTLLPEQSVVVDCESENGTFINGQRTVAAVLRADDLLQVAQYGWVFSEKSKRLVPAPQIPGVGLTLRQVRITPSARFGKCPDNHERKYREYVFSIPAGEFWVVRGPSGGGKSTLIKRLAGIPGGRIDGDVLIHKDGETWNRQDDWLKYQQLVGYVSQDSFIHRQLTPREALASVARLRGISLSSNDIQALLYRLDLDDEVQSKPVECLSGGQERRVRTAAALIAEPGILLLDEPDRGLDYPRQRELMRLLRTLSHRGCTVLMVSHGPPSLLEYCDCVLYLRDGKDDSADVEVKEHCRRVVHVEPERPLEDETRPSGHKRLRPKVDWEQVWRDNKRQCAALIHREWQLRRSDLWKRGLIPVAVIPLFFAFAVGLSVERGEQPLLGFLSILSCLWMGASLSLMSITDEREIFDYERALFLRVTAYVTAKAVFHGVLSAAQSLVFILALWVLRRQDSEREISLFSSSDVVWTTGILLLVGWIGVSVGLLLSTAANRHRDAASVALPLLLILQIVTSVYVADTNAAHDRQFLAYGRYHLHSCIATPKCKRRAEGWRADAKVWICKRCDRELEKDRDSGAADGSQLSREKISSILQANRDLYPTESEDEVQRERGPTKSAIIPSYFTFSRYADIALRSQLDVVREPGNSTSSQPQWIWLTESLEVLVCMLLGLFLATLGVLRSQQCDLRVLSLVRQLPSKWTRSINVTGDAV